MKVGEIVKFYNFIIVEYYYYFYKNSTFDKTDIKYNIQKTRYRVQTITR